MIYKLKGIVLTFIKFKETSIIVNIYTDLFGLKSYIVSGVRQKKSNKLAVYQPLSLLELVVYNKTQTSINRIKESKIAVPYRSIPFYFDKCTIGLFITEILNKILKESEVENSLFDFIYNSLIAFDHLEKNYSNFHLQFLLKLTHHLGFGVYSIDHLQSKYLENMPTSSVIFLALLNKPYSEYIRISKIQRQHLIEQILAFYQYRFNNLDNLKSLSILKSIYA